MSFSSSRLLPAFACVAFFAIPTTSRASAVDWTAHAGEEVIRVVTTDEDGSERSTKIWLVVVEGQGYVRTGSTSWGRNVERDPRVRILTGSAEYAQRVEFVTEEAERARVTQAFRDKYGWPDRLLSVFRGRSPKIMRLVHREGGA